MNGFEVKLVNYDALNQKEKERQPNNGCGREAANYLRILYNGQTISIFSDAMEPEDARFTRDLFWIAGELILAYEQGRKDG